MNDLLIIVIAVAIGTPTGMLLAALGTEVWYAIHDRIEDMIRNRRRKAHK